MCVCVCVVVVRGRLAWILNSIGKQKTELVGLPVWNRGCGEQESTFPVHSRALLGPEDQVWTEACQRKLAASWTLGDVQGSNTGDV